MGQRLEAAPFKHRAEKSAPDEAGLVSCRRERGYVFMFNAEPRKHRRI